jgi:DNA-binding NtrC family response regulator
MGILIDLIEYRKARANQTVLIADGDHVLMSLLDEFVKSEFPGMAGQLAYNGIEAQDQ